MTRAIGSLGAALVVTLLGAAPAGAQDASEPPMEVRWAGPSLSLPVCAELPFDASAFVRDLQVALSYHRAEVRARHDGREADPAALAVTIETACDRGASRASIFIAHLGTGKQVSGRVQLEGDDATQRGQWLARATARLLDRRWADLSEPSLFPTANPYLVARFEAVPDNPYREGRGSSPERLREDATLERNPYLFQDPPTRVRRTPRVGDQELAPENPYRG